MSRFSVKPDYYSEVPYSDLPIQPGGLNRTKKLNIYYIDINSSYRQDQKGLIVYDEDAIKVQIANIMSTPLGSDHFEPTYGSNVPYRLQDPINERTSFLLRNDTIGALGKWMAGRITVNAALSTVRPIANDPDAEGYEVKIYYSIIKANVIAEFHSFVLR